MRYGYLIVSDLLQFSPNDLMKLRNFGKTTLNELNSLLALYGLSLKKPSPSSQQIAKTEKQLQKLARMKKRLEPSERELAIKKLRSEGLTLAQIGERFSISTEYVRQLLLTCELKQEKRGTYSPDGYLGKQAKRLEESMKCELAETSAPSCAPSY